MAKKYTLRQAAKDDLTNIGQYTLKNHGRMQRDKYLKGLEARFKLLAENPTIGRCRDDIKTGYHCSEYKKHVVFYLIRANAVEILAVLHESMMPDRHL